MAVPVAMHAIRIYMQYASHEYIAVDIVPQTGPSYFDSVHSTPSALAEGVDLAEGVEYTLSE